MFSYGIKVAFLLFDVYLSMIYTYCIPRAPADSWGSVYFILLLLLSYCHFILVWFPWFVVSSFCYNSVKSRYFLYHFVIYFALKFLHIHLMVWFFNIFHLITVNIFYAFRIITCIYFVASVRILLSCFLESKFVYTLQTAFEGSFSCS